MKAKKKARKHRPDWPLMFADKIDDHEKRIAALERAQAERALNQQPTPAEGDE